MYTIYNFFYNASNYILSFFNKRKLIPLYEMNIDINDKNICETKDGFFIITYDFENN